MFLLNNALKEILKIVFIKTDLSIMFIYVLCFKLITVSQVAYNV